MASKRILKRDINYVMGDIIEAAYIQQIANPNAEEAKTNEIVDEAIATFDELIADVNKKDVENPKQHFKSINKRLEEKANILVDKINAM